jgi:hypothetical protein
MKREMRGKGKSKKSVASAASVVSHYSNLHTPRPRQEHADPPHHEPILPLSHDLFPSFHRLHRLLLEHASDRDAERGKGHVEKGTVQLLLLDCSPGEDRLERAFGEIGDGEGRVLGSGGRSGLV